MEIYLILLIVLLLFIIVWLVWRYSRIRQGVNRYTDFLFKRAENQNVEKPVIENSEVANLATAIALYEENQKQQLKTLNSERARLANVLEQMTDGVLIATADGIIEFANPTAKNLLENQDLEGKTITEALRHHQFVQTWQNCIESGQPQSEVVELPIQHKFLQLIATPDLYIRGGCLLLIQDLTQLRRLETVRRDFISNISHELRTPLASLKALTETLQDGAIKKPKAAKRFLKRIEIEVDAITQMAQELLDLSRIESGQVVLNLEPIDPLQVLQNTAERMQMQVSRAELKMNLKAEKDLLPISADESRLEQVFVNLIHNAIKFTPPKGTITLGATNIFDDELQQNMIQFFVQDTGEGISDEELTRIFERFYKTDRARASRGTGLGLSIARHVVEAHGGKIWAESRKGRGSTFFFTIPVATEHSFQ